MTATLTTTPKLKEINGKLTERRAKLKAIFDEAGPDLDMGKVKSLDGDTHAKVAEVRTLNDELIDLGEQADAERALVKAFNASIDGDEIGEPGDDRAPAATKAGGYGDLFLKAGALDPANRGAEIEHESVDVKTLMETTAGWAPDTQRTGKLVLDAQRPVELVDLIPSTTTEATGALTYWEETTFTSNAAETSEGAAYKEAAFELTEITSGIRKVTTSLPVTDEQLDDRPRARGYIENRLPFQLRQRLSLQIAAGDGNAPNLRGMLNVVGIQTQAKGADPTPDAVYKAMVKVMTTGQAMPDAYVTNPLDWQAVRLLRTTDGIYIWGSPSEPGPDRIWGLRTVLAQAMTENTGVVGDFANFSELALRQGIVTELGYNSDDWTKGKQTFRSSIRAALLWYRPAAFCTVTGI